MAEEDKTQLFGNPDMGEAEVASGMTPPYMVIVDGPHKGARFSLKQGDNIIGRLEECNVILDDQSVSRKHSEISFSPQGWTVKDLQSKNGTYVNGTLIQETVVIGHKDTVQVGIYTLRLVTENMDLEEEMDIPVRDSSEMGTMLTGETKGREGEMPTLQKDVTAPHSPLEDEDLVKIDTATDLAPVLPEPEPSKRGLPKARLAVLVGILFAVLLVAGLYFYWRVVLSPEGKGGKKPPTPPVAVQPVSQPQSIPLGPPEPPKPRTVPIFLDCVANPFPAVVRFQDKEIGKTPLKLNINLIPGQSYDIEATFDMIEIGEKYTDHLKFSVTSDQSTVPLLFRAPLGTLKITALPRDVSLYLEGYYEYNKFQAKPVKLQNLVLNKPIYIPFGRYVAELRKAKQIGGSGSVVEDIIFHREFVLEEDRPTFTLEVTEETLQQFPAEIRSIPPGADVFVDQQKMGQTPFMGTLPLGIHKLTLRKDGYFEFSQDITTDMNTLFKTEVTLKTSPAGEKINTAKGRLNQGLYQEAVQSLSEVFTLNPTPHEIAEARMMLGNLFLQVKDYDKALGYFEQAKTEPDFKYWAKLGMARVLAEQKQMQQALIPLVEVLLNAKDEAVMREAHVVLGTISPLRSVVYIQSDPPGATVFLNEKKIEQVTPILLHEMGLGNYHVHLEMPGYQNLDLTISLTVNEFNPVIAILKPLVP
ncbi:MAG: PEGA domain-containing protein [Deltaproteobacteria bacterium]|nr:PEGA domain-containing protein [Deltaproteobacteria bacterium]